MPLSMMRWALTTAGDPRAVELARRHYSRRPDDATPPSRRRVVGPGRRVVLITPAGHALWATSHPAYSRDGFMGWRCTIFRNESPWLSSELILEALAASRHVLGEPPPAGVLTYVDPARVRAKRHPGYCFLRAGFQAHGYSNPDAGHGRPRLLRLILPPDAVPAAAAPLALAPPLFA